jgi:hypothetical protein
MADLAALEASARKRCKDLKWLEWKGNPATSSLGRLPTKLCLLDRVWVQTH